MRRSYLVLFVLVLFVALVFVAMGEAQTTPRLAWSQPGDSLTQVQAYTYRTYLDNSTTGVLLSNVTCSGAVSPFPCTTPLPTFSTGRHTLQLTAHDGLFESVKSSPLDFGLDAPLNLRIIP